MNTIVSKEFVPRGEFQTRATQFILRKERCNLFCDLGIGKTVMTLNAIDVLIRSGEIRKVLIVAPLRVARTVWKEECAQWNHLSYLKVATVVGTAAEREAALKQEADIYCINFENLPWLKAKLGDKWPFKMVVVDESSKLKSHRAHWRALKAGGSSLVCTGGVRTSALAGYAFKRTKYWVNLTGTPASRSLEDLWGSCWFIDGGKALGNTYGAFEARWFRISFDQFSKEMLPNAEAEIRAAIAPTTFVLRAEDYMQLGEEITNTIYVDLPPKARMLYNEMEKELCVEIESGTVEAFNAAAKTLKLLQIGSGSLYYDDKQAFEVIHKAKLEALEEVIEEACGVPLIVIFNFKSDLIRLKEHFPKGRHLKTKKDEEDFKAGKIDVLFVHPASAGHGINGFQNVTNKMCFFSLDWSAENRQQVIGRIGRVRQAQSGFDRPVFITNIVARDTLDEIVIERLESKMTVEQALKSGLARKYARVK